MGSTNSSCSRAQAVGRSAPRARSARCRQADFVARIEVQLDRELSDASPLWPGLTRLLVDPAIPIDNNHTERAMRGVAVSRKNHYGSRSQRGTEVAALFDSLVESSRLVEVEPARYLRQAA